ncbi:gliding motility-associated C-terminal domain-containing protein [Myroides sp. 1354]|uniref:gliding motility-associated C-terminal domain-containing protein n=1 Tax=unclassified Myroides TaxID=2642485 RepID=UPI002576C888|nr:MULTISPECIES: gliding motility-associated C-terminal domain-containing protein [unclassified Myroides]MDM1044912.1 gliding motility-associated C-terminal domain-containing protein [Myroides sp. R163-1]MDM1055625.1 gliding motility-associated C-terminal domain-containing protein [Myroides sp. 1354]MDM1068922.1 gliding motility-associated C-terminal domain-containing protein [Myroides sp. 1372]
MRYFACVVVFFCFCMNALYGQQNLVLNPSFEDVNEEALQCDSYQSSQQFENAINNWKAPIPTPDIYHFSLPISCQNNPYRGNVNLQLPRTGSSMVGMAMYVSSELTTNTAEFPMAEAIEGRLSTPLLQGHRYRIRLYVLLSRMISGVASNNFGIKFFEHSYSERTELITRGDVDVNYTGVIRDTQNWSLIELEFTPQTSGLTYFILTNFFLASETTVEQIGTVNISYYFIDDIEIIDLTPSFQPIGPFCKGAIFTLPEVSDNGYSGTWSPSINNQETTTYTFTPDNPELEQVSLTVEIIEPHIEPIFDIPTLICKGTIFTLPNVSENGIRGTWSPEINNQQTTTYTFTPEVGSCASETSITIEVVDILTPEFTLASFICEGNPLVLPNVSNNGISGTWTPAVDNKQTTTYTFTPVGHACALPIKTTVEVKRIDTPLLNSYCAKNELYVEVVHPNLEHQFQWQINGIAIDESLPTIQLSKYVNLLHDNQNKVTVSMTNPSGCVTTNTIEIENKNLCLIPKGISPQGDGLNDTFDISHFGGVSLQIFNRYGMKVYNKKNYQNEWFGQTNSSNTLLPSGTYFYQIVTNRGEVFTGWVQLMY